MSTLGTVVLLSLGVANIVLGIGNAAEGNYGTAAFYGFGATWVFAWVVLS